MLIKRIRVAQSFNVTAALMLLAVVAADAQMAAGYWRHIA